MITIKTPQEINILTEGGKILASILKDVSEKVEPRITTKELDDYAFELIKKVEAKPALLGYRPRGHKENYPATMCISINDEIVHGVPSGNRILKEGDIVGLDLSIEYKKLIVDSAITIGVGEISNEAKKLIKITKQSLDIGIAEIREGAHLGDYGFVVQRFIEKNGFNVVRNLVGHGVGYSVHEDPDIPNWGRKGGGLELKSGMVLALEPMACQGKPEVLLDKNSWTWKTEDGLLSAHFEHTVAVEKSGCRVLTPHLMMASRNLLENINHL